MDTSEPLRKLLLKAVRDIADYQFGRDVGEKLFPESCRVQLSKRTGKPRYVYLGGDLLATIRYPDNLLALTLKGAERLREVLGEKAGRVIIREEAVEKLRKGMSPAASDLVFCSDGIRPGDEVVVEAENGRILAVGRAVVSAQTMREAGSGVVVKVRKACKT